MYDGVRHKVVVAEVQVQDQIEWRDCCSLHAVTLSVIYYSTHEREIVIYLFYAIKLEMVY